MCQQVLHWIDWTSLSDGTPCGSSKICRSATCTTTAVLVQEKATSGFASSLGVTFQNPTAVGHVLVFVGGNNAVAVTVTGGGVTGAWTRATFSREYANIEILYGIVTSPATTVTVSGSAAGESCMDVTEWSGIDPNQGLVPASAQFGTIGPALAPTLSTSATKSLLIFGVGTYLPNVFGTTPTGTGGTWSAMTPLDSGGYVGQGSWYQVVFAAGSYQPSVTQTNNHWDAAIAAFKILP